MKKLVFGLIATVLFGHLSFCQEKFDASNSENEFDYIGKAHNEGLAKILEEKENLELFKKDPIRSTTKTIHQIGYDCNGFTRLVYDCKLQNENGEFEFSKSPLTEETINTYNEKKEISNDVKENLIQILDLLNNVDKGMDFNEFKERMIQIETRVDAYDKNDREFLLSMCSISRHSVMFWMAHPFENNSARGGSVGGAAATDLGGAVAGGIRYGVGLLIAGPFGWGALGVACLAGGLGASAAYGVYHLFY